MAWTSKLDVERWTEPPADASAEERVIRHDVRSLMLAVLSQTPQCADQSAACREIRVAMHWACDAIRCQRREPSAAGPNAYLAAPAYGPGLQGEVAGR